MNQGKTRDFIEVATNNTGAPTPHLLKYFPQRTIGYLEAIPDNSHHTLNTGQFGVLRYLRFTVEELKPYIGRPHSASTANADGTLMGSST